MNILDAVVGSLVLMLLLATAFFYIVGGNQWAITKKCIRWAAIFLLFSLAAKMCIPH